FLREHLGDEKLKLPPVYIYSGRLTRWLTNAFDIVAITFGRRIFVAPQKIERDAQGRLTAPASLIAHEATHVLQYDRAGFVGFLISYLAEFTRLLREQRQGWGKPARKTAYFSLSQEREAYEAERAYQFWRPLERIEEEKTTPPVLRAIDDEKAGQPPAAPQSFTVED
ncbi:MAG TPA: DUF4157 domain-containing protein, partial [Pyrinomonadaceae bacterium]|nr:DUF4157 domain-containing protein [Pyrinomonadaceae bacterium]